METATGGAGGGERSLSSPQPRRVGGSQRRPVVLAILLTSLAWVVVGGSALVVWRRPVPYSFEIQPPPATATPLPTATPEPLLVEVVGAVNAAGVYALPRSSRVMDAIAAAGGLRDDAEGNAVSLARALVDGEKVLVPVQGDATPELVREAGLIRPGDGCEAGTYLIPINTATVADLEELPGIGPKTAQAIVDYRSAHGPFRSLEEILEVKGIGEVTLERIRDLISLN
jgi:competence protein ComEA